MTITKSKLEEKWYFRVLKVFFLILPLLIVIFLLLNGKIDICNIPQKNISDIPEKSIVYILIGLALYYLILSVIWRIFLYLVFGGLVDDKKNSKSVIESASANNGGLLLLLVFIIVLFLMAYFNVNLPKQFNAFTQFFSSTNDGNNSGGGGSKITCPTKSNPPCNSVKTGIRTSGVIVPGNCNCPSDTEYAQMDNITKGGPYKICKCK